MLKQRLVGALVIIALGVLLWPLIFVDSAREPLDRSSQVPAMPSLRAMQIEAPQQVEGLEAPRGVEEVEAPLLHDAPPGALDTADTAGPALITQSTRDLRDDSEPREDTEPAVTHAPALESSQNNTSAETSSVAVRKPELKEPARLDEEGIPVAWVLQVATLSSKQKAQALAQQLVDREYKAYFRPFRKGADTLYKVYVGPNFDRQKILDTKASIDNGFKVNSIVARYVP